MYCQHCTAPITPGLSFCNRCGANLKDRPEPSNTGAIGALLTAVTLIGLAGLGVMLGGALVLRRGALLSQELIGVFMLFTFLLTGLVEVMLIRNLSKLISHPERKEFFTPAQPPPLELRPPAASTFGEPVSVTENTTRTLGYVRREQ
jgi:hypothetical protein